MNTKHIISFCIFILFSSTSSKSMLIKTGNKEVYHSNQTFYVKDKNKIVQVQSHWVDKPLRNIPTTHLAQFLDHGYIRASRLDNGEFAIRANVRGNGGGPISGAVVYWLTKTLCYGTASGTAIATTATAGVVTGAGSLAAAAAAVETAAIAASFPFTVCPWLP